MLDVVLQVPRIDQDIVKVCRGAVVQHVVEDVVDIVLERCRGSLETERRYQRLVEAETRDERGQPFVAFHYTYLIESGDNVKFREKFCFADGIESLLDQRDRVTALHRDVVDAPVVDADTDSAPRLLRQQDW